MEGVPLPPDLLARLHSELAKTRWPAATHRSAVNAQHYLVLIHGKTNDGYMDLTDLLAELLAWIDPDFGCTQIAVTKNFEGSTQAACNMTNIKSLW